MLFRPLLLDLVDGRLKEVIGGLGGEGGELLQFPLFGNLAQVGVNFADGAGLFPGFAAGGLFDRLVDFPAAFGEDPAAAADGLDEEDGFAVVGEGHYAGDEALALRTVSFWEQSQ